MTIDNEITPEILASAPKQLRDAWEREKSRRMELEARELGNQLRTIGLDSTKGLGKAIAREYSGPLDEGSVATYAEEEYGYTYEPPVEGELVDEAPPDKGRDLAASARQIDDTLGSSVPSTTTTVEDLTRAYDEKAGRGETTREESRESVVLKLNEFLGRQ